MHYVLCCYGSCAWGSLLHLEPTEGMEKMKGRKEGARWQKEERGEEMKVQKKRFYLREQNCWSLENCN